MHTCTFLYGQFLLVLTYRSFSAIGHTSYFSPRSPAPALLSNSGSTSAVRGNILSSPIEWLAEEFTIDGIDRFLGRRTRTQNQQQFACFSKGELAHRKVFVESVHCFGCFLLLVVPIVAYITHLILILYPSFKLILYNINCFTLKKHPHHLNSLVFFK